MRGALRKCGIRLSGDRYTQDIIKIIIIDLNRGSEAITKNKRLIIGKT